MRKHIYILTAALVVIAGAISTKTYMDYRREQAEIRRQIEKKNRLKQRITRKKRELDSSRKRAEELLRKLQEISDTEIKKAKKLTWDLEKLETKNKRAKRYIREFKLLNEIGIQDYTDVYDPKKGFKTFVEPEHGIDVIKKGIKELNLDYGAKLELKNGKIYGVDYAEKQADIEWKRTLDMKLNKRKQIDSLKEIAQKLLETTREIEQINREIKQVDHVLENLKDEDVDSIADDKNVNL